MYPPFVFYFILSLKTQGYKFVHSCFTNCPVETLVIGLPGKGDPGTTGWKSAKIEEECAPVPGSFWSSGPFSCPRIGGHFQASVGGCHCLPLSHCLSDLPRVETLLSDHARRLGELSNFNVKSCDSSRYPRGPPSRESR